MSGGNNKGGSGAAWLVGILIVLALLTSTGKNNSSNTNQSYSRSSGKPRDMPQDQWDYVNNRLSSEFRGESKRDIESASRAIWEFEKQRRARGEY